ncbi:MFS transporter [Streptomyces sp. MI02-7b]|uniref:MFS transporter n=1 Tax=Streptomyces sp. MI02-7b TaxID=462941 RepID=UPI0029AFB7B9|nr:MFS transporter [Streptomyces sp. MI02-7b]MDX3078337.1 MFS transporter [Streptomyces sp. MI02-7b]
MLVALMLDRTGTGVWSAVSVLYFTFVVGLDAGHIGLLLGAAGAAGIAGSPVGGRLAGRHSLRTLLIGAHLLRMAAVALLLVCDSFATLLPVVTLLSIADRAARTWEMLFATRVAGEQRVTYRALSRVTMNIGYAVGAGIAALGIAVGTRDAYGALVMGDAVSFLIAALIVGRTREVSGVPGKTERPQRSEPAVEGRASAPTPWRDLGYLRFVLLDTPLNLDSTILSVGLPLWLFNHTTAPHTVVPTFLIINTVLVVVFQMPVSRRIDSPRRAGWAVVAYGSTLLACCVLVALSPAGGAVFSTVLMLAAAGLVTGAELMRAVSSWELAVCLAPNQAQPAYLGVAGLSASVAQSVGPLLLADAVMVAGPVGWLALGAAVMGLSEVQRRSSLSRLNAMTSSPKPSSSPHAGHGSGADGVSATDAAHA